MTFGFSEPEGEGDCSLGETEGAAMATKILPPARRGPEGFGV